MQNKIVTLIASVLKPVDDTRMFEKIGLSLHQSNKYEVNIIGFQTKNKSLHREIRMIQAFNFSRLSIQRIFAPLKFFRAALSLKPALIIITTHELILPAILYKCIFRKTRLVYDVQENYYRNMLHQGGFSKKINLALAIVVRSIEKFSTIFFSTYLFAEVCYTKEISFSNTKSVTILNKFNFLEPFAYSSDNTYFSHEKAIKWVYPGTIHPVYGIMQTLDLAKKISVIIKIELLIIGSTKDVGLLKYLVKLRQECSWLRLCIEENPIPHQEIMWSIQQADFGIVSHQPIPSIANCFPTRIYELMAYQKPILLQNHPLWTDYCYRWDSAIAFDYNNFDPAWIAEQMTSRKFYQYGQPDDVYWESEEKKLLKGLEKLF